MSSRFDVSNWKFSNFLKNKNYNFSKDNILNILSKNDIDEAYKIISRWNDYSPTPLVSLNKLSKKLKFNKIFYKDESKRFNLKSFKALGGAYAVAKISRGKKKYYYFLSNCWQSREICGVGCSKIRVKM